VLVASLYEHSSMQRSEIEKTVKSYIEQDLGGQEIENQKCDFKAKWYDLKNPKDINEFLKDTSAIANTFGLDGLIIIGYDNRQKSFTQASFSDSNLKDTSYLSDLINKRIDRLFDISDNPLNPTGLIIIEKNVNSNNEAKLVCPVSKSPLRNIDNHVLYSDESLLAYPIIKGIPCLLQQNAVLATHFNLNYEKFKDALLSK